MLHHVRTRYRGDEIYTLVGSILVALNPFRALPIYGLDVMDAYVRDVNAQPPPPPHIFFTAALAFEQLRHSRASQSLLISGGQI